MANQEQVEILKQGAHTWGIWRVDNSNVLIDLTRADLSAVVLREADLKKANLKKANLKKSILVGADLSRTNFSDANLSEANLSGAKLSRADLCRANLSRANLIGADLSGANLIGADLNGADLTASAIGGTNFGCNDLSCSIGLEKTLHQGPSTIGTDTIRTSKGKIPMEFLRGCGLNDWEIEAAKLYNPDLSNEEINDIQYRIYDLRATQALQISPLFISYSHADGHFVDKLETLLYWRGIRFWRDIHDATAGRLEKQIDRAIRSNPTVLLILSKNSVKSDWVQHEVRTARELEKKMKRDVLCPVALDDSWKRSSWPKRVMEQVMEYNILDYSCWEDEDKFRRMFGKLADGLNLYYRKDK